MLYVLYAYFGSKRMMGTNRYYALSNLEYFPRSKIISVVCLLVE